MKVLNTSVAEYIVLLQMKDISRHRILFPVIRVAVAMVTNCRLLVVLWSGNDNELYQLQVHIFSVIHLVHLFITKVW